MRLGFDRPVLVLGAWTLVAILATPGVLHLEVETSTNSVLDTASSEWAFYLRSQDLFGGDEVLTVLLEASEPLDEHLLSGVRRLSDSFETIPGVARVDSLRTVPSVHAEPDGQLSLDPLLGTTTPHPIRFLEARIRSDRIAPKLLISDDMRAASVNLVLEKGSDHLYRDILTKVDQAIEGSGWSVSGVPVFRVAADVRTRLELLTFVPLTIALIALLLVFIFRSPRAALIPLGTTGMATWLVMGVMGSQNVPVTITTVALPSVLLALGCAYGTHLIHAAMSSHPSRTHEALYDVALPVALSGLTTAVGFVAVSLVRIEAVQNVGTFGALGVLVILFATLTAGPAALRLWPLPSGDPRFAGILGRRLSRGIVDLVRVRRRAVLVGWFAALAITMVGIGRLNVETDVILWFDVKDPIRSAYERIRSRLVGISPMNVIVESSADSSVSDPRVVDAIDRLDRYLESREAVGRSIAITDSLRQMHGAFVGDANQPLPSDQKLIEQYLLLLESKEFTRGLITQDHRAANISLRMNDNGSAALLDVAAATSGWWRKHGPQDYQARTTGIMYEFARAEDEIAWGQIRGLTFAVIAIVLLLLLTFRSPMLASLALVPNAVPVALMFGCMGLLGYPIDAGTVIVGNLALGIAVDDTIHVAEGFARRRAEGATPEASLRGTLAQVLAPITYTTAAIALGFATLALSGFGPVRNLGMITAFVMMICLLADLVLFPALLARRTTS